jgi:uncharacterized membrane protein YeaQ/YmgE (transglycosylase-associated protein family)
MKQTLAYLALFLVGMAGSLITKKVQMGSLPMYAPVITSMVSGLIWGWLTLESKNLSLMSIVVNVIYSSAFVFGFYLLGEQLTTFQLLGFVVSLIGIAMITS